MKLSKPEYEMKKIKIIVYSIFWIIASVCLALYLLFWIKFAKAIPNRVVIYALLSIMALIMGILTSIIAEQLRGHTNEYRAFLLNKLSTDATPETSNDDRKQNKENSKADSIEADKDIIALMLKNNDELTEYFKISKTQSRWSFWISTVACISGIVILGITIYSVVILKQTDIAVVGVISGAITELIAGTIFWLHNKSALQLNHYYDALHENEKVLLAINLTNTLSSQEREGMCKEIIRTQIYKQKSSN